MKAEGNLGLFVSLLRRLVEPIFENWYAWKLSRVESEVFTLQWREGLENLA